MIVGLQEKEAQEDTSGIEVEFCSEEDVNPSGLGVTWRNTPAIFEATEEAEDDSPDASPLDGFSNVNNLELPNTNKKTDILFESYFKTSSQYSSKSKSSKMSSKSKSSGEKKDSSGSSPLSGPSSGEFQANQME